MVKNQLITRFHLILPIAVIVILNIGLGYWFKDRIDNFQIRVNGLGIDLTTQEETIKIYHLEKAREVRTMLEYDIKNLITIGQIVATLPEVQSGLWNNMKDTLLLYEPQVVSGSYMVFDYPNGTSYTTIHGRINASVSDRQYFQMAINGKVNIGTTIYSRSTGLAVHVTAIPVFNGSNIVGVLVSLCVVRRRHESFDAILSTLYSRKANVRRYSPKRGMGLRNAIGQTERLALSGEAEKRLE